MKSRLVTLLAIASITLLLGMFFVSAEEITISEDGISTFKPSYSDNFVGRFLSKYFSQVGSFTVYGDELGCDDYPAEPYIFKKGTTATVTTDYGESVFVNWFRGSPYDGTYSSHPSSIDSRQFVGENFVSENSQVGWTCDAGGYWDSDGDGLGECYVEYYSCPNIPCYSDSDCASGETCVKDVLSQKIPNAGVCKVSNPTHQTNVYRCEDGTKTSLGKVSYGNSNFCTNPSASKYLIGTTDQCLTYEPSICNTPSCTPSSTCASNTCIGQTCSNGCGGIVQGTKDCSSSGTCSDGIKNQGETGIDCGGPCNDCGTTGTNACGDGKCSGGENYNSCPSDCHIVIDKIQLATPSSFSKELPFLSDKGKWIIFIENKKDFEVSTNIEFGYYTEDYGKDVAGLPSDSLFAIVNPTPLENCVVKEGFVKTIKVTLDPHEKEQVYVDFDPTMVISSYITKLPPASYIQKDLSLVAFAGNYETCCELTDLDGDGLKKECSPGTGGYQYYATEWNYKPSISCLGDSKILCDGIQYGTYDCNLQDDLVVIENDYRACISKEFSIRNLTQSEIIEELKGTSLIEAKKISLTKEEIGKSTTTQLLASACKFDSECLKRNDESGDSLSISCNSLASLREDGTLTESDEKQFLTSGKTIVTTGVIGGALGGTVGLILCGLGIGAAEVATGGTATPLLIPATATCASLAGASALVGSGFAVGGILAWDSIKDDDKLVKAFKEGDANAVGICTAEKSFDFGNFIDSIGKKVTINKNWSDTTNGLLVIGGGIFILFLFLNVLGGRKK